MKIFFRKLKPFFIICIAFSLFFTSSFAAPPKFEEEVSDILRIQRQFLTIARNGFANLQDGKSNQDLLKLIPIYVSQIDPIRDRLLEYRNNDDLDSFIDSKIETLLSSTLYLKSLAKTLEGFLSSNTANTRFNYLYSFIQTYTFLSELFGLFNESPY